MQTQGNPGWTCRRFVSADVQLGGLALNTATRSSGIHGERVSAGRPVLDTRERGRKASPAAQLATGWGRPKCGTIMKCRLHMWQKHSAPCPAANIGAGYGMFIA